MWSSKVVRHRGAALGFAGTFVAAAALAQGQGGAPPAAGTTPSDPPAETGAAPYYSPTPAAEPATTPAATEGAAPAAAAPAPSAEPPPAIYVEQPPLPPLEPRTRHYHDGFYLRLSMGFGALGVASKLDGVDGSLSLSGSGFAFDLLAGGTPAPGLVIGGGLLYQEAFDPNVTIKVGNVSASGALDSNQEALGFALLGPMVDAFPNPNGGFHLGGLLGFAQLGLADSEDNPSGGFGLSAWAGYMWWASSEWSLGALVRLSVASTGRKLGVQPNQFDATDTTRALCLMFSAAYH